MNIKKIPQCHWLGSQNQYYDLHQYNRPENNSLFRPWHMTFTCRNLRTWERRLLNCKAQAQVPQVWWYNYAASECKATNLRAAGIGPLTDRAQPSTTTMPSSLYLADYWLAIYSHIQTTFTKTWHLIRILLLFSFPEDKHADDFCLLLGFNVESF